MTPPIQLFLGIDGGGSHTRALLADVSGETLGRGVAAGSNPNDPAIGWTGVRAALDEAVNAAFAQAGVARAPAAAAFLGMAGVRTEAERESLRSLACELSLAPSAAIGVDHDLRIAFEGALPTLAGVALIAGTGSAGFGRNANGDAVQVGGWGPFLDDAGGGSAIGRAALVAIVRAEDGRDPPTALRDLVLERLALHHPSAIVERIRAALPRPQIAALSTVVIQAADEGDAVAAAILDEGAGELARITTTAAHRLGLENAFPVALCGGLIDFPSYRSRIRNAIKRATPHAELIAPRYPAVAGSLFLAMQAAGTEPAPTLRDRLALPTD